MVEFLSEELKGSVLFEQITQFGKFGCSEFGFGDLVKCGGSVKDDDCIFEQEDDPE